MEKMNFFASTRVRNIYFSYLLGAFIIVGAIFFITDVYQDVLPKRQSAFQLASSSAVLISAAQSLPDKQVKLVRRTEFHHGMHVTVTKTPPVEATIFNQHDTAAVSSFIMNNPQHFNLSINVGRGNWLTMRHRTSSHRLLFSGFVLSIIVLALVFAALLLNLVRRVAYPLDDITASAKKFAIDVNAPPMALSGPPELQQAINAFNSMQGRVRQLVEDRTQMLAAISHDLRTPITRLQLRAEFMPEEQREKAIADLLEMEQMINSILSFARDYNSQEVIVRVDINALLETICNNLLDVGSEVEFNGADRAVVQGRMLALKRALTNLIENAVKYGKSAQVMMQLDSAQAIIKIKDQGPGIPESEIDKVFRPFYRVDAARTSGLGGSGLGLAVARDIIRANGGDIQLSNLQPHGLQVTVSLPLAD